MVWCDGGAALRRRRQLAMGSGLGVHRDFRHRSIGFSLWLIPRDPALLASRLGPLTQRGQPLWDKLFLIVFIGVWFAWLVLMGLDAQRWRTSQMPVWLNAV